MSYQNISRDTENHVKYLFDTNPNNNLVYHNFEHTRNVADYAEEIALFYKLDEESQFIIKIAALFHDVGYLFTSPDQHEQTGVHMMQQFVLRRVSSLRLVARIRQCIMATKKGASPQTLQEKILCDADTYHFGTPEFKRTDPLIKKEIELQAGSAPKEWISHSLEMLRNHQFYTSYCKERLDAGKELNILWLQSLLKQDTD